MAEAILFTFHKGWSFCKACSAEERVGSLPRWLSPCLAGLWISYLENKANSYSDITSGGSWHVWCWTWIIAQPTQHFGQLVIPWRQRWCDHCSMHLYQHVMLSGAGHTSQLCQGPRESRNGAAWICYGSRKRFQNLSSSVIFHIANNELYVALCVFLICFT